ncbi:Two-component system sensor kinase [[Actinomadura] parvosata subsp. kistnae]|uniref:histidine kinase n=1 Tax=[Actinomadura] parvosata subsp. kistnae TaxID=1909395 RepID=A0A1V0AA75_9ACTN|nr:histidine kinase [Nonomuraea sp. ATCC 55076]AQZ67108.1 two-component sensor histidine kinase [Nonomuraea sp. ATCC 55076]SPL94698.1 Two-component system sensor kinase [Actinomadura parvosata subsp. kistnae]
MREWWQAAGTGVACAVVLAFWAHQVADSWGGGYWIFGCAAGAVVCALALVRRRARLPAAVAGLAVAAVAILVARLHDLPAEPGPGTALGLSVLVGSAFRTLPLPQAAGVGTGGLAVALASQLSGSPHSSVLVLNVGAWLAALAGGLGPRLLARRRAAAEERVRQSERLELARELHDVVAHHVTCVVLQAQAARLVARKDPERVAGSLADIEAAGSDALAATRRVVGLLRERGGRAAFGPAERLGELVARFSGPPVTLRLPDGEPAWPSEVAGTVYRVVQESLTNVSRHAPEVEAVVVSVTQEEQELVVEVTDDAPPPHRTRGRLGGGYGLVGMRERVEALGGRLTAGPRPEGGWTVHATLPLPERVVRG